MAQIIAKSKHIILKNKSKWNQQQLDRARILFDQYPLLKKAYDLSMKLTEIFNRKNKAARQDGTTKLKSLEIIILIEYLSLLKITISQSLIILMEGQLMLQRSPSTL